MYGMIPFGRMNTSWNDLFDDFERRMFPADRSELPAFRTDIRDEGDHFLLEADLPGFRKEDIDLHLQNGVLTITARHQEEHEEKKRANTSAGSAGQAAVPGPSTSAASGRRTSPPPLRMAC